MGQTIENQVEGIREVILYLKRFRGQAFVIKIDYPVVDSGVFPSLVRDVAELQQLGIRVLIVAGAREHIDDVLDRYAVYNRFENGIRISSPDAMPFIKMAAFDAANRIMTSLTANGVGAVIGNWVRARTKGVVDGVDYMSTGEVERIDIEPLEKLLADGMIPIFPCIGWSSQGEPYNISSNRLASVVARSVGAEKLFFLTGRKENWPSRFSVSEAAEYYRQHVPKDTAGAEVLELAIESCRGGVTRAHIIDGLRDGAILQEIFTNRGAGSMVYANLYERIRPMKFEDVPDALRIMEPWVQAGHLIPRDETVMERDFVNYVVYDVDGSIHGCGGLLLMPGDAAEIVGLSVDSSYVDLGIGRRIAEFLVDEARRRNVRELFLLTTQAFDWFRQLGFAQCGVESLPEVRRKSYDHKRNSRIMVLELTDES